MVKVVKQRVKKKTAKKVVARRSGGVLDRIIPISQVDEGIKFLIYGIGKTGKTRIACGFPKPLLLIGVAGYGTEKGTRSVKTVRGAKFVPLEESEEVEELVEQDEFKTYVLDTAGGLQERVVNEYTKQDPLVRRDWRQVNKGDWGPINSKTMERLRCLLDAADLRGKNVVIIAHERAFNAEGESGDLLFPHVGASLTPGVASWLDGAVDYIGQCFIREGVETKDVSMAGKTVKVDVKTGDMEYCLRVGPHPVYKTGFRVPVGTVLPDVIVDPNFSKINKLINQGG